MKLERKKKMTLKIEDLLEDVKAYRNTMVARNFPHQEITNLIMKWDQKILEETPEYKLKMFQENMLYLTQLIILRNFLN